MAEEEASLIHILEVGREQYLSGHKAGIMSHAVCLDAKKGVNPVGETFYCESCDKTCDYPQTRYRLNVEVSEGTTSLQVTLFDDLVKGLVKRKATTLLDELETAGNGWIILLELEQLIGSTYKLELKSHTYFDYRSHEGFTATKIAEVVLSPENPHSSGESESGTHNGSDCVTLSPSTKSTTEDEVEHFEAPASADGPTANESAEKEARAVEHMLRMDENKDLGGAPNSTTIAVESLDDGGVDQAAGPLERIQLSGTKNDVSITSSKTKKG